MEVRFWAATDSGRKRSHNEDNFLVDRDLRLFLVCDGMGGHAAGEVASAAAIQTVREEIAEGIPEATSGSGVRRESVDESEVFELLERAVRKASERVRSMAQSDQARQGMGTTCSLLMFVGGRGFVAHVGDSRIYRLGGDDASQMTDDHSLRNHMIREGRLEEDEPLDRQNAVTRAVGIDEPLAVDTFSFDPQREDRFVLCSDGLSDYLERPRRLFDLAGPDDLEEATQDCIDFANRSGGKDNVTVIVVEVTDGEGVWDARRSTRRGRALRDLPHFEHLKPDEFQRVSSALEIESFEPGDRLGAGGAPIEALVIVLDGRLELLEEGEVVDELGAGEWLGERSLLGAGRPDWSLRSAEPSGVALLQRRAFDDLLRSDPELASKIEWNFLHSFAERFREIPESAFRQAAFVDALEGRAAERSSTGRSEPFAAPDNGDRRSRAKTRTTSRPKTREMSEETEGPSERRDGGRRDGSSVRSRRETSEGSGTHSSDSRSRGRNSRDETDARETASPSGARPAAGEEGERGTGSAASSGARLARDPETSEGQGVGASSSSGSRPAVSEDGDRMSSGESTRGRSSADGSDTHEAPRDTQPNESDAERRPSPSGSMEVVDREEGGEEPPPPFPEEDTDESSFGVVERSEHES